MQYNGNVIHEGKQNWPVAGYAIQHTPFILGEIFNDIKQTKYPYKSKAKVGPTANHSY